MSPVRAREVTEHRASLVRVTKVDRGPLAPLFRIVVYRWRRGEWEPRKNATAMGYTLREAIWWHRCWRWRGYDHQEMPSEKVLRKLRARRDWYPKESRS